MTKQTSFCNACHLYSVRRSNVNAVEMKHMTAEGMLAVQACHSFMQQVAARESGSLLAQVLAVVLATLTFCCLVSACWALLCRCTATLTLLQTHGTACLPQLHADASPTRHESRLPCLEFCIKHARGLWETGQVCCVGTACMHGWGRTGCS